MTDMTIPATGVTGIEHMCFVWDTTANLTLDNVARVNRARCTINVGFIATLSKYERSPVTIRVENYKTFIVNNKFAIGIQGLLMKNIAAIPNPLTVEVF